MFITKLLQKNLDAHNYSNYNDPISENSEIKSTFDDSDRDRDFSSSER